jgi:hypothetical protein
MKIELLMRRNLVRCAEIDHVLRTAALGKGPGILDVCVPGLRKLPVKKHTRLACGCRIVISPIIRWNFLSC